MGTTIFPHRQVFLGNMWLFLPRYGLCSFAFLIHNFVPGFHREIKISGFEFFRQDCSTARRLVIRANLEWETRRTSAAGIIPKLTTCCLCAASFQSLKQTNPGFVNLLPELCLLASKQYLATYSNSSLF